MTREWRRVRAVWRSSLTRRACEDGRIRLERCGVWVAPAEIGWAAAPLRTKIDPSSCWELVQRGRPLARGWDRDQSDPFPRLRVLCTFRDAIELCPCATIVRETEPGVRLYVVDARPAPTVQGANALVFVLGERTAARAYLPKDDPSLLLAIVALEERAEHGTAPAPVSGPVFSHARAGALERGAGS